MDRLGRERQSSVANFSGSGFIHVRTDYDRRGHKTFESQPYDPGAGESGLLGTRYLSYDVLGRLTAKEQDQANGTILSTSYTHTGFTTTINAGGLLMHRIYNGLEQLVETKDAMGGFTRYAYDGAGNPIVLQDPNGHSITASFNALGHKLQVDDPNMGAKSFATNALGEVLSTLDANGDAVGMSYDPLGRLTERSVNGVVTGRWHYNNPAADKGLGLLDYEDNHAIRDSEGLRKEYFYSPTSSGRKALTRVVHCVYQGSPSVPPGCGNGSAYEVRHYIPQKVTATAVGDNQIHLTGGNGAAQAAVAGALQGINNSLNQAAISDIGALAERDSGTVGGADKESSSSPPEGPANTVKSPNSGVPNSGGSAETEFRPGGPIHPQIECHMACHGVDYSYRRYATEAEMLPLEIATMAIDLAIPLPPIYTAVKGSTVAARGSTTLYRAVSEAEALSVRTTARFSAGPNSVGGKWFAETLEHAKQWGDLLNGRGASRILEVRLPNSAADQLMRLKRLDGIGPARYGELGQLEQAIIRELP